MGAPRQRLLPEYLYSSRGAVVALAGTSTTSSSSSSSRNSNSRGAQPGLGHVQDVLRRFRLGTCFEERSRRERCNNATGGNASPYGSGKFMIPAASEPGKIPMYSAEFYAACTVGGILSCGITHTGVTPLDIVKCNMQVHHLLLRISCPSISIPAPHILFLIIKFVTSSSFSHHISLHQASLRNLCKCTNSSPMLVIPLIISNDSLEIVSFTMQD
jgi:hypothetical protein